MAQLVPIRGIRYTPAGGELGLLLAPPYDVVGETEQAEWLGRNPYNALHLELPGETGEPYVAAARALDRWLAEGVIRRDPEPMYYIYEQVFRERGEERRRTCLLAGVEAQPWESGAVKPHEFTMSGPKEDRLRLLEATGVQFSPLLMIARDRSGGLRTLIERTTAGEPHQEGVLAGESHRLWRVPEGRETRRMVAPLATESFYIADGHHRYETAVLYKQRKLQAGLELDPLDPARFVLAGIVAADDPGLVIRPTHRFVPRRPPADWRSTVERVFAVETVQAGGEAAAAATRLLEERPEAIVAAGLEESALHILSVRDAGTAVDLAPAGHSALWANLQSNLIRYGLLEPLWGIDDEALRSGAVEYSQDAEETVARVREAAEAVAFLNHAVPVNDVITLADQQERMPQKSTFFHPKLATGLVFYPLRD